MALLTYGPVLMRVARDFCVPLGSGAPALESGCKSLLRSSQVASAAAEVQSREAELRRREEELRVAQADLHTRSQLLQVRTRTVHGDTLQSFRGRWTALITRRLNNNRTRGLFFTYYHRALQWHVRRR